MKHGARFLWLAAAIVTIAAGVWAARSRVARVPECAAVSGADESAAACRDGVRHSRALMYLLR